MLKIKMRDELGYIVMDVDEHYGISILNGEVCFTTVTGEDYKIPVDRVEEIGTERTV